MKSIQSVEPNETPLEAALRKTFARLSNSELVARANSLPDFEWDDEGAELCRRKKVSNGKFDYKMILSTLVILKDEQ